MNTYRPTREMNVDNEENIAIKAIIDDLDKQPITPALADQKILELITEGLKEEAQSEVYLGKLMSLAKSPQDREIIRQIRLDDQKHYRILADIYNKMVDHEPDVKTTLKPISGNVTKEYERSILSKLKMAEFYRKIYFAFLNLSIRDMMYEIITDEQDHGIKFTYLYSKSK